MSNRSPVRLTLGVALSIAFEQNVARAGDCLASTNWCNCPATDVNAFCGGGDDPMVVPVGAAPFCGYTALSAGLIPDFEFKCVLDINNLGPGGGSIVMVLNADLDIEASGIDPAGVPFCCKIRADPWGPMTGTHNIETKITGSVQGDVTIAHTYTDAIPVEYNLEAPTTYVYMKGYAYGNEGDDTIVGSNSGGNNYHEWLYGEDDDDIIHGGDYWDTIFGGSGNDDIYGEGGPDTIDAGSGQDYVVGGDEPCVVGACSGDNIDGGHGADVIFGGTAEDTIQGDGENDCIDGEEDHDTIHGGVGDDVITGGTGVDDVYGDAGDDTFYMNDNETDTTVNGGLQVDEHEAPAAAPDLDFYDNFVSTAPTASPGECP